jgi:hypothetical protein
VNGKAVMQLGLGLMGLWLLVQSVWAFAFGLGSGSFDPSSFGALTRMIPAFALLGFSYALVFHGDAIATRFFPQVLEAPEIASPGAGRVAVGVLGLLLLGAAIPRLADFAPSVLRPELLQHDVVVLQRFSLAGAAGQVALALWLIRRPEAVLSLWLPDVEKQVA